MLFIRGESAMTAFSYDDFLVSGYFHDIANSDPLPREREVELSVAIRAGDMKARDELIEVNLRFVVDVAKSYQNRGLSLADLISAGNFGLITAAERFDGSRGFKFISYAVWWIRQSILREIAENGRAIRLPLSKLSFLKDIFKARKRLRKQGREDPIEEDIARELDVSVKEVLEAVQYGQSVGSLDLDFDSDDSDTSLLFFDILSDDSAESPDSEVSLRDLRDKIQSVLSSLDEREERVIRLYHGLDMDQALTLEQIGSMMGLTRERVRQLKERALSKLRGSSNIDLLRESI